MKYKALTIAGSDSGGGAGIQADLKTFAALGCYGTSAITALTAQNTMKVSGVFPASPAFVEEQIRAVLSDIGADAIKVGMLFSKEIIESVAKQLSPYKGPLVVDPVMVAKSGDLLLQKEAIKTLTGRLFPLATLITPNLEEAAVLIGHPADDPEEAAKELLAFGSQAVLLKGGHQQGESSDDLLMLHDGTKYWLRAPRILTKNTHGTGCSLSSAITALLAQGYSLETAVKNAKEYISEALKHGIDYTIGQGCGPLHHFWRYEL